MISVMSFFHHFDNNTTGFFIIIIVILCILCTGCVDHGSARMSISPSPAIPSNNSHLIQAHYSSGEITNISNDAVQRINASLQAIAAIPPENRSVENTLIAFDTAITDYRNAIKPLRLMGYVYPDMQISDEGRDAEASFDIFLNSVYSRNDLYTAIKSQSSRTLEESRLYQETLKQFKHYGVGLDENRLSQVKRMRAELVTLESEFNGNLNNDNTILTFTADELNGVSAETLLTFSRTSDGLYQVTMKGPDYNAVMKNANSSDTRKRVYIGYLNRQAENNSVILQKVISLRYRIAEKLGYPSWADYQLGLRLAKNVTTVKTFLSSLKPNISAIYRDEIADLLSIKQSIDPLATSVDPWDILYLQEIRKTQRYGYNDDEIREYYPFDQVLNGMFQVFGSLFGITFKEIHEVPIWAEGVRVFSVINTSDNAPVGYLYIDPFPRVGKGGHFYTFSVITPRMQQDSVSLPVVAVVGNFDPADRDKPALMTPDEIEILFHETGHALHMLFDKSPYGTQSSFDVPLDFLETPSLSMQEWAWDPEVLRILSGFYANSSQSIPQNLIDKIITARKGNNIDYYSTRLIYALEDMDFCSAQEHVNITAVWEDNFKEITGMSAPPDTWQPASSVYFTSWMNAGVYGYLWSKVYAMNIVDVFKEDGMMNQTTGLRFRHDILEKGNMEDGDQLVRQFLGFDPRPDVMYKQIGINSTIPDTGPG